MRVFLAITTAWVMKERRFSHVIGIDDAPFAPEHRGDVKVIGAVFAEARLDGVLCSRVRRDGANATDRLIEMVAGSRFYAQLHVVMLQGIALAGFNVVDILQLHETLQLPVVVISRKLPDLKSIKKALLEKVPGGRRKWHLIEQAGPMEEMAGVYVQRVGLSSEICQALIERTAVHSAMPEPLRAAHLIAGGIVCGESRHRV